MRFNDEDEGEATSSYTNQDRRESVKCSHAWIDVTSFKDSERVWVCLRCRARAYGDLCDSEMPPSSPDEVWTPEDLDGERRLRLVGYLVLGVAVLAALAALWAVLLATGAA